MNDEIGRVERLRAAAALLHEIADRLEAEHSAASMIEQPPATPQLAFDTTWLTESEAAEYGRLSKNTLRNWRMRQKRGEAVPVEAHKFGARVLYDRTELERAIRDSTV